MSRHNKTSHKKEYSKPTDIVSWKKERRKAYWIWLSFNLIIAGFLCIIIGEIRYWDIFGFGEENWFYVLNREAYNGYFYALSVSLIAESLSSLLTRCYFDKVNNGSNIKNKSKGKRLTLIIVCMILLCVVSAIYAFTLDKVKLEELNEVLKEDKVEINYLLLAVLALSVFVSSRTFFEVYPKPDVEEGGTLK